MCLFWIFLTYFTNKNRNKIFYFYETFCYAQCLNKNSDKKVEMPTFGATEFFNDFIVPKLLQWNPRDNKDTAVLCFSLDLVNELLEQSEKSYCQIRFRSSGKFSCFVHNGVRVI